MQKHSQAGISPVRISILFALNSPYLPLPSVVCLPDNVPPCQVQCAVRHRPSSFR